MQFKDLFSKQSRDYFKFRPTYPPDLFSYLASIAPAHDLAWDVGTGNGQAAVMLAAHFARVVGTDPSRKQIESAARQPNIEYQIGPAETSSFSNNTVDIVTAAQSFHWFNHKVFFQEVGRVLKPGGVLAFWCYGLATISPAIDAVIFKLYHDILGPYWEFERTLVDEGYRSIQLPFEEIITPKFSISAQWSLDHLIGYLSTWSALHTYIHRNKSNPLDAVALELQTAWGREPHRPVRWDLALRAGKKIKSS